MADQASVNGRGAAHLPGFHPARSAGVAEFVDDLSALAELQAKLAAVDLRDGARKSAIPTVLTVMGFAMMVGSVQVAIVGAGLLLATALHIHQGWALLMTAGVAMALGGLIAVLGAMRVGHSFRTFHRSGKQLRLNMAWVRTALGASARSQLRCRS